MGIMAELNDIVADLNRRLEAAKGHGDECSAALEKAHVRIKELTQENSALMEGCKRLATRALQSEAEELRSRLKNTEACWGANVTIMAALEAEARLLREVEAAARGFSEGHTQNCKWLDTPAFPTGECECRWRILDAALTRLAAYRSSKT